MTHPYRISPEGDAALLVSFGTQVRDDLMARARRAAEAIEAARLPEVTDVVGGYASVLVAYDPLRADYAQMEAAVAACLARPEARASRRPRLVTIPVCYGGDLGPDIQDVAHAAGMDVDEVVRAASPAPAAPSGADAAAVSRAASTIAVARETTPGT